MSHKLHKVAQIKPAKAVTAASPYHYWGRTQSVKGMSHVPKSSVPRHQGGTSLRRGGLAKGPTYHGLKSWLERGGGHGASYKD